MSLSYCNVCVMFVYMNICILLHTAEEDQVTTTASLYNVILKKKYNVILCYTFLQIAEEDWSPLHPFKTQMFTNCYMLCQKYSLQESINAACFYNVISKYNVTLCHTQIHFVTHCRRGTGHHHCIPSQYNIKVQSHTLCNVLSYV